MLKARKRFHSWQAPLLSFFSRSFYADVANNWTGTGIGYMTLLSVVAWFVTVIFSAVVPCWNAMNNPLLITFLQQVPKVTCDAGQISIDRNCPYRLLDEHGVAWAVFRTDVSSLERLTPEDPHLVITREELLVQTSSQANPHRFKFAQALRSVGRVELNGPSALPCVRSVLTWLPLVVLICGFPVVWLSHLFQMLCYALIALGLGRIWKKRHIPFRASLRLGAMSITPNVVLCTFFTGVCLVFMPLRMLEAFVTWAPVHNYAFHHIFGLTSIGIALLYVFLAIHSIELVEEVVPNMTEKC